MELKVGDEVFCIDDGINPRFFLEVCFDFPNWVKKGQKYTVRKIRITPFGVSLLLEELVNPLKYFEILDREEEPAFSLSRFAKEAPLTTESVEEEELVEVN